MTNLDSILKSRYITLPTNVLLVKATVFPVIMYGCESRTIKKAEHQRTDAFELIYSLPFLLFKRVSSLHQVAKGLEFTFSISHSNEYSGLISFRMDWLDLLAVQGTLKSLLYITVQKHQFFGAQLSL